MGREIIHAAIVVPTGPVFWIDTADGLLVVRKESGAVWALRSEPRSRAAFGMPSVAVLHRALRTAGSDPTRRDHVVPVAALAPPPLPAAAATPVDIDQLRAWMRPASPTSGYPRAPEAPVRRCTRSR
jgi:hypothetical protein